MIEIVHCVYKEKALPSILLHILAQTGDSRYLINLIGVNIGDDVETIVETATISLGFDILGGEELITPHCQITTSQLHKILSRSLPEVSKHVVKDFPGLIKAT